MSKFKVGDKVQFDSSLGWTVAEIKAIDGEAVWLKLDEYDHETGVISLLKTYRETQNWFGIKIDKFDTRKPEIGEYYYALSIGNETKYSSLRFNADAVDCRAMACGYWFDKEKANRSAPLMYQHMVEMATGE